MSSHFIIEMKCNEWGRSVHWCRKAHGHAPTRWRIWSTNNCWVLACAESSFPIMKFPPSWRTPDCAQPRLNIGDCAWKGQAGCAWMALEKWCLQEWAFRRGISPLPLKQWAVDSGSDAGAASTPLSQIRQAEMATEAAHSMTHTRIYSYKHTFGRKCKCACVHTDTGNTYKMIVSW